MRFVGTTKGNARPLPPPCLFYILFHNGRSHPKPMGDLRENGAKARRPMSIRRLAQQLGRNHVSVHSETSLLIQTGLIMRTAEHEVRIGWDKIVTELNLAA